MKSSVAAGQLELGPVEAASTLGLVEATSTLALVQATSTLALAEAASKPQHLLSLRPRRNC